MLVVIVDVDQVLPSSRRGKDLRTHTSIDDSRFIIISGTRSSRLNALEAKGTPFTATGSNATSATVREIVRERLTLLLEDFKIIK